jgi:hypothetical protein
MQSAVFLLTRTERHSTLASPLPHLTVRTTTPEPTGQKAAIFAAFYCPSEIIDAGLIRIKSFMVGCIGHLSGWPVPVAGCSNPVQPATQRLLPKSGGYIPYTGETAMRNLTQKPTSPTLNVRLKSLFTLVDTEKRTITENLSFQQVKHRADRINGSIIKFQKMEAIS